MGIGIEKMIAMLSQARKDLSQILMITISLFVVDVFWKR